MIKDIKRYKDVCKLKEYKENSINKASRISKKEIDRVKYFISDCGLNIDNLYVSITNLPEFRKDKIYYYDGVFFNVIKYPYLEKNIEYQPTIDLSKYDIDENGKMVEKATTDCDKKQSKYDWYKGNFLEEYEGYMKNYNNCNARANYDTSIEEKFYPLIYSILFTKMNNIVRFYDFIELYKIYDFTKQFFNVEDLNEISNYVPKSIIENRLKYDIVKDNVITVYRGEEGLSSTGEMGISWTTDIDTAKFFASRFKDNGKLLKGKVNIKDIIIMFDREPRELCEDDEPEIGDSEKEVLVKPNSVFDIKIEKIIS